MLGKLSDDQIIHVLQAQLMGRIGCYAEGKVYIVPVSYAYQNGYIYAHSKEGLKIHMMRQNPAVCFQVEQMDNLSNWRSVILWGNYEELRYPTNQVEGRKILEDRLNPYANSETVSPMHDLTQGIPEHPHLVEKPLKPVVFRIHITESTGRFEKTTTGH